jgi:putative SOS response-associated peptidase YedK
VWNWASATAFKAARPFTEIFLGAVMCGRHVSPDAWLTAIPEDAFKLLRQYPDTHMVATPVSRRVDAPKNNDAELITPAAVV